MTRGILRFNILGLGPLFMGLLSMTACSYSFFETPSSYPSGTTAGDFPSFDHYKAVEISPPRVPTDVALEVVGLFKQTFQVQSPGQIKCANVKVFQKFVQLYFNTSSGDYPTLQYLCLFQPEKNAIQLTWRLNENPKMLWSLVPPYKLINTDLQVVKTIDYNLESSFSLAVQSGLITLKLNGVTINLTKAAVAGTPYSWIPEALLKLTVDEITLNNAGQYLVNVKLPLGITYAYKGNVNLQMIRSAIRIQGENFYLAF